MLIEDIVDEKKDACYSKVRSRYKVWPSAYASGALVQCRKKGAANWGNKSESIDKNQHKAGQVSGDESAKKISPILGQDPKKHPYNNRLVGEGTDQEGEMAVAQLKNIADRAMAMAQNISPDQQLEAWVQSLISRAEADITDVHDFLKYNETDSSAVNEVSPEGEEEWIKHRKEDFKKRYGKRWKTVLYATAWKRHNAKK
jgi:hypothetical protein